MGSKTDISVATEKRHAQVLKCIADIGPCTTQDVCQALNMHIGLVGYSIGRLRESNEVYAFGEQFSVKGGNKQYLWLAGAGEDYDGIKTRQPPWVELDFKSTAHLQPIYIEFTRTRTPDDFYEMP